MCLMLDQLECFYIINFSIRGIRYYTFQKWHICIKCIHNTLLSLWSGSCCGFPDGINAFECPIELINIIAFINVFFLLIITKFCWWDNGRTHTGLDSPQIELRCRNLADTMVKLIKIKSIPEWNYWHTSDDGFHFDSEYVLITNP